MIYPYITLHDETEITHSQIIETDGNMTVEVHFERPKSGGFDSARCVLPTFLWEYRNGFSDAEIAFFEEFLHHNQHLLFKYARKEECRECQEVNAMRDPKRIKAFCDRLAELWEANCPDLRFAQLLACVLGDGVDRFYVEDDALLQLFQDYFSAHNLKTGKNFRETLKDQLKDPEFTAEWEALGSECQSMHSTIERHPRNMEYRILPAEITEKWCADTNLSMAIGQIARDEGISQEEALARFKQTRVYNARYDFGTGMWGEGPASLVYLYHKFKDEDMGGRK